MNDNDDSRLIEKVTSLLMGYKDLKLQAQQLNFEIENYVPVASDDDMIDAMTFGKLSDAGGTHIHNSLISDKTARIAIAVEQRLDRAKHLQSQGGNRKTRLMPASSTGFHYKVPQGNIVHKELYSLCPLTSNVTK